MWSTFTDSGTSDSGTSDSGTSDSGTSDSGTSDSGTSDSGTSDSGTIDWSMYIHMTMGIHFTSGNGRRWRKIYESEKYSETKLDWNTHKLQYSHTEVLSNLSTHKLVSSKVLIYSPQTPAQTHCPEHTSAPAYHVCIAMSPFYPEIVTEPHETSLHDRLFQCKCDSDIQNNMKLGKLTSSLSIESKGLALVYIEITKFNQDDGC